MWLTFQKQKICIALIVRKCTGYMCKFCFISHKQATSLGSFVTKVLEIRDQGLLSKNFMISYMYGWFSIVIIYITWNGTFCSNGLLYCIPGGSWGRGELPCKMLDNARWKIGIKSLKETNLGTMVQALFVRPKTASTRTFPHGRHPKPIQPPLVYPCNYLLCYVKFPPGKVGINWHKLMLSNHSGRVITRHSRSRKMLG